MIKETNLKGTTWFYSQKDKIKGKEIAWFPVRKLRTFNLCKVGWEDYLLFAQKRLKMSAPLQICKLNSKIKYWVIRITVLLTVFKFSVVKGWFSTQNWYSAQIGHDLCPPRKAVKPDPAARRQLGNQSASDIPPFRIFHHQKFTCLICFALYYFSVWIVFFKAVEFSTEFMGDPEKGFKLRKTGKLAPIVWAITKMACRCPFRLRVQGERRVKVWRIAFVKF